ncbi:MAG TPA: polynucleotide adenylyltransferase PcnB [Steroidobacteraceae bacterium]
MLYRLKDAGYQAFLVGGCVRDLMLGIEPKDFDVATNALPEQVKRLFRNCRLIGRRFRLAHVFYGRDIIEVATFRAASAPAQGEETVADAEGEEGEASGADLGEAEEFALDAEDGLEDGALAPAAVEPLPVRTPGDAVRAAHDAPSRREARDAADAPDTERVLDEHGRILRDNMYGTIDDDVWRRDFTANALYYNIADFSIWDYVDGAEDVRARRLKLIGDPETRYREDPVRLLRGARFEAKLGFTFDAATAEPIPRIRTLLADVPPARLFDETLKLFLTGHGAASLRILRAHDLLAHLLPSVDRYLLAHPGSLVEKLLVRGLENTDERVRADKPVTPTFLFALLLYGPIAAAIEALPPSRWHEMSSVLDCCDLAVREAQQHMSIPRRFALGVREMFAMQPRLEQPRGRRALRLLEHPRFRAGYDLMLLRAELGLASSEMGRWWTRLQEVSAEERAELADQLPKGGSHAASGSGADAGAEGAPARRGPRRRRRRPARG